MKKVLFLTICAGLLFVSNSFAQVCGGSYLYLEMVDAENGKTIENANYRLFYVYPKSENRPTTEEITDFAAQFYYGENRENRGYFYKIYDGKFLEVEAAKAEEYIRSYNEEGFKNSFNPWKEKHERQLTGKTRYGKIQFEASEMDDTPFLLKIEAENFKPVYLFSNFLGGCYRGATYKIEMKPAATRPLYKCLPNDKDQIKSKIEKFVKRR